MTSKSSYILLLVSLSFPIVLCKHDYFQYYSKYIKGVSTAKSISSTSGVSTLETSSSQGTSTTEVISSSTSSAILSTDEIFYSNTGGSLSVEVASSEDNNNTRVNKNVTVLQGDSYYDNEGQAKTGAVVGSVMFFILSVAYILCCCQLCRRRGRISRGYVVIGNRTQQAPQTCPQPIIAQTPQEPVVVQHLPPQYMEDPMQQFPHLHQQPTQPQPPYAPVQPGYQYSPNATQFYNPPEPPPPYETTPYNKY